MEAAAVRRHRVEFGLFEVDLREQVLHKRGALVHLQDKPFQVLAMLLERPGEILGRDELQKRLWPGDTFVEFDEGLNTAIRKVRLALGDSADSPTFIETVPRRGYRFIASVRETEEIPEARPVAPSEPYPSTRLPDAAPRRSPLLAAALATLVVAAVAAFFVTRSRVAASAATPRIAVLPFESVGVMEDEAYFADGIADAVRGKLSSLPGIQVIARSSSTAYRKTTKMPAQVARELEVNYLLTGTVRQTGAGGKGSRVEVTPELVEIGDSGVPAVKWQQDFEASMADVFQVQSRISSQVAQSLGLVLAEREQKRLGERPTLNLAAYDAFLRGEQLCYQVAVNDPGSLKRCLDLYERAVALDPDFPEAWASVAITSAELYRVGVSAPAMRERAEFAAGKAATLGPDRPDGYIARSLNEQVLRHDLPRALEISEEGRRRWPTNAVLLVQTANLEVCMGRWAEAVDHYRQSRAFDPRSAQALGEVLTCLRRYPEALEAIERAMAIGPLNLQLVEDEVNIFAGQGDLAGARAAIRRAPQEMDPGLLVAFLANQPEDFDVGWVLDRQQRELLLRQPPSAFGDDRGQWGLALAMASALNGDVAKTHSYAEQARRSFEDQLGTQPDNHRTLGAFGLALAYLGRKEEAIRAGQRATAVMPVSRDAGEGAAALANLVRIYIVVGEQEKALDLLEGVLKLPGFWAPGWLRIDPNFDPVRKNPRFQKLAAGTT